MARRQSKRFKTSNRVADETPAVRALAGRPSSSPQAWLPPEILSMIVSEVAGLSVVERQKKTTLCVLARTSRFLQAEAERKLYFNIDFRVGEPDAEAIASVLQSRAARYVRSLSIQKNGPFLRRGRSSKGTISALPFSLMTNLQFLVIHNEPAATQRSREDTNRELFRLLEQDLPHGVLTMFACSIPLHLSDLHFLWRQPNLKGLLIFHTAPAAAVPSSNSGLPSFSKLTTLEAPDMDNMVLSVMAVSKIRRLTIRNTFDFPANWFSLASHIVRLDLLTCVIPPGMLEYLVASAPRLQILLFAADSRWKPEHIAKDALETLGRLPDLMALGFTEMPLRESVADLIKNGQECKTLESVLFVYVTDSESGGIEPYQVEMTKSGSAEGGWTVAPDRPFDLLSLTLWLCAQESRITEQGA
ncbi:hypothetical protein SISNIDRAFT_486709 [Sistotremastrum niveocremeum HHB9708]|uniref:F-box domain-containing protein n=1 Tax=Sistotremastrum niveocremeum HHB9708 TaxID=1314777 RepID=A0A164T978_9AGAM|nr:hypothetical protein SISNIDRAFT_486709 [Sistotremastrum niveocremeum HHB9708]